MIQNDRTTVLILLSNGNGKVEMKGERMDQEQSEP